MHRCKFHLLQPKISITSMQAATMRVQNQVIDAVSVIVAAKFLGPPNTTEVKDEWCKTLRQVVVAICAK